MDLYKIVISNVNNLKRTVLTFLKVNVGLQIHIFWILDFLKAISNICLIFKAFFEYILDFEK